MMWNTFENAKEILKNQYRESCWRDGLEPDTLKQVLSKVMEENDQPFARAKCIDLVLRQAQIDICPEEFFVDKINHTGLLNVLFYEYVQKISSNQQIKFIHWTAIETPIIYKEIIYKYKNVTFISSFFTKDDEQQNR